MDDYIDNLINFMQGVMGDIDNIDDDEFDQIMQFLGESLATVQHIQQQATQPPIPLGADILWEIASGNPDAFINYLRTVPDPALNALAANHGRLQQTIRQLSEQRPSQEPQVQDGIEQAPLRSSNIWGYHFSPRTGDLLVRFNEGGIYHYSGVPPEIFQIFQSGAIPARTNGENKWGKWWVGKSPSLGSSFYELIRDNFPYERVA